MNIANFIAQNSKDFPARSAMIEREETSFLGFKKTKGRQVLSYEELHKKSNVYANAFLSVGIKDGTKVLVFIPPSFDFPCITFALFKIGAVPVFIDPGMGKENLLKCISGLEAEAMIGVSKIHYLRSFNRKPFSSVKIRVNTDGSIVGSHALKNIIKEKSNNFEILNKSPDALAAILFTSGGTGTPKGVEYTSSMLYSQTLAFKKMFKLTRADVDYPGFPPFCLFTLSLGLTSVITAVDASAPSKVNPKSVIKDLEQRSISFASGSPSIWKNVADYCIKKKIVINQLRVLAMFGAPVRHELLSDLKKVFPASNIYTPYGATESLPVSLISAHEVLSETKDATDAGKGVCVGYPAAEVRVKILKNLQVSSTPGEIGEVLINSPYSTKGYYNNEEASKQISFKHDGQKWHRMGDMGYMDTWGRLWFLGRKSHMLTHNDINYYPVSIEGVFNQHPAIEKSALAEDDEGPCLVIQRKDKSINLSLNHKEDFFSELENLSNKYLDSEKITKFHLFTSLPVDTRHNIKIDRLKISRSLKSNIVKGK